MKNKIVLILSVFVVMVLSVVSVYGITEQSREVEEVYAAVPAGAFLAKFGVRYDPSLYTYFIDASVTPPLNGNMGATGSVFTAYYSDGSGYFYAGFNSTSTGISTYLYPPSGNGSLKTLYSSSSWNSSLIVDGHLLGSDGSFSRLELSSSFGTNNWLYVVPNSIPPVTQSTTVVFNTAQIDSLTFDGLNFTTTGQSQDITYDDEDEYYTLSVTPKSGFKATYAVVEYLNDADNELPARYQILNNTAQIACPVGDAITSITIESESIYATNTLSLTFGSSISQVELSGGSNNYIWTQSATSQTVLWDNPQGEYLFELTFSDSTVKTFVPTFTASSESVVSGSISGNSVSFTVPVGQYIESISFAVVAYQSGILMQQFPYYEGGTYQGFEVVGYNDGLYITAPAGYVFSSFEELKAYFLDNYEGVSPAGNIISVYDDSDNVVSFPLTIDGQFLYLRYSSVVSDVAFSVSDGQLVPNFLGFDPPDDLQAILSGWNENINWLSCPQFISANNSGYFYFTTATTNNFDSVTLSFPDRTFPVPVERVSDSLPAVQRSLYRISTADIPQGYYLNLITLTSGANSIVGVFHFSEIPGGVGWNPDFGDSLFFLAQVFDGVLDILDAHITPTLTIGTIFMAVLALGVLLFIFRISGVF